MDLYLSGRYDDEGGSGNKSKFEFINKVIILRSCGMIAFCVYERKRSDVLKKVFGKGEDLANNIYERTKRRHNDENSEADIDRE